MPSSSTVRKSSLSTQSTPCEYSEYPLYPIPALRYAKPQHLCARIYAMLRSHSEQQARRRDACVQVTLGGRSAVQQRRSRRRRVHRHFCKVPIESPALAEATRPSASLAHV